MYNSIASNKRNTILIFVIFIAIIGAIGGVFAYVTQDTAIFIYTLIGALGYAGVEYYFSSKIAIAMSGAHEISRDQAPEFYAAVDSISITAGIPMPKLYIINDVSPNAFAAGTKPENSIVCATTGLLDILDKPELEAVVAHEVSHIKNYDIRVSMMAFALAAAIGFMADIAFRIAFHSSKRDRDTHPAIILVGILVGILAPFAAFITKMAVSRQREYLADASAVMLTRYPKGMIDALNKISEHSRPTQKQNTAMASMYFANPLKKSFFDKMFSTHPPIEDRIKRLEKNSGNF